MDTQQFKALVASGGELSSTEVHDYMNRMSDRARRFTSQLHSSYHSIDEVRDILSELMGYTMPQSLTVFPPFYTDYGLNTVFGENVFVNACCHFQDQGGIVIGDGCQIGHNVVFATLNHGLSPEDRPHTYPSPIRLGRHVWVGSNTTFLPGVTIGDNAIVAAGAVVSHDVAENTIVGGVPAKFIKNI